MHAIQQLAIDTMAMALDFVEDDIEHIEVVKVCFIIMHPEKYSATHSYHSVLNAVEELLEYNDNNALPPSCVTGTAEALHLNEALAYTKEILSK